jgi:hypothetical protein
VKGLNFTETANVKRCYCQPPYFPFRHKSCSEAHLRSLQSLAVYFGRRIRQAIQTVHNARDGEALVRPLLQSQEDLLGRMKTADSEIEHEMEIESEN